MSNQSVRQAMLTSKGSESGLILLLKPNVMLLLKLDVITLFRDSLYYKKHVLFKLNINNVAILFYFDDFETVNPLGSKTGGHKLCGIYCVL